MSSGAGRTCGGPREDFRILLEEDDAPDWAQYGRDVSRRNWAFDIVLAVTVGLSGQFEAWWGMGSTHRQGPLWVQSGLYGVTAALLVFRRVRPLTCLIAMVAVSVVEFAAVGSPEGFAVALAPLIATYTVANRLPWRRSWIGLALSVLVWLAWALLDPMNSRLVERLGSLVWLAPSIIAWLIGSLVRSTRLNAEQRRVNRAQRAAQAVAEERTRIARELHDVVGHSISVMTVQASAVRRRLGPDQAVERHALEAVEATGREAMAEMRRMVGMLRESQTDPELEPVPGLGQVDRLVEKFRAAGLPVSVSVTGAARELTPGLDLAAYRLIQEGLTNTLRHARNPQHVEVVVDYGTDRLDVVVRDDGETAGDPVAPDEPGAGLTGMRERVAAYAGSFAARSRPDGGFEMVASLPVEPA